MANGPVKKTLIEISICMGTNCTFRGASHLLELLQMEDDIQKNCNFIETHCQEEVCEHSRNSPVVKIDNDLFIKAKPEVILDELHRRLNDLKRGAKG